MLTETRFDGRVAIVTGAGRGLGRAYSFALAARGARVVVNDLASGEIAPANTVAAAIRAAGGVAVASNQDITDPAGADGIVATALDVFGRVDIVINNAGVAHVGKFDEPVDRFLRVLDTNLMGSVHVTRTAWPHLLRQGYGRVVMTTSAVGLWGAPDNAAYASAKAGLVGLALALAHEGGPDNVLVNCVAPAAETRLTQERFPHAGSRRWRPELVAPAVLYLAHESCQLSGAVVSAFSGLFALVEIVQGRGHRFDPRQDVDVEDFVECLDAITSMSGAHTFADGHIDALGRPLGIDLSARGRAAAGSSG